MAVALRSSADLLCLPDHGFIGESGAFRILPQLTRIIRRIDISHNLLGSSGILTLFQGIGTMRTRYCSSGSEWGLTEVNLGFNDLDDAALRGVLSYAKKDRFLQRVLVQGNSITLKSHLESIISNLNESNTSFLSLTNNSIDEESVGALFDSLTSSHLRQLHLSTCDILPSSSGRIASFFSSERCRLESLELNGNALGAGGVTEIIDAVEGNTTILSIGLLANQSPVPPSDEEDDDPRLVNTEQEDKELEYQVHHRLPLLLARNRDLTRRVRQAASRMIAPARIILNAQRPTDEHTAQRVIQQVGSRDTGVFFRLLDLPEEIVWQIVRHASRDATALSDSQFVRLRTAAMDRQEMNKLREKRGRAVELGRDERDALREVRNEWLREGGFDRWQV